MLAARGVAAMQIVAERGRVDAQLTGEHGQDLGVSVLADVQHATGVARIAELDGEAQLRRRSPVPANQPQVVVREGVEAGEGALIEAGREFGELGALGRSEQLAGGHGRA